MTFLNIILLGGISTAAIPLIIHLFNRRRFQVVKWGAMHLLETVLRTNRRRINLEQLILLILRATIPALLALCMARPVLTSVQSLVRNARTSMVLLFDNSLSMEAGDAVRSNLAVAREESVKIADNLPRGSELALVGMAGPISSLAGPIHDLKRMRKELDGLLEGFGTAKAHGALEVAAGLFSSQMHHADRELVVISDFQKVSWTHEQSGARSRATELLETQPVRPRIVLFRAGREVKDNVSVESLKLSRSLVGINQKIQARANIRNFGETDYPDLRVYFRVDGKERSISQISLAPGENGQVLFSHEFDKPGSHVIEVYVDADRLKADNSCLVSLPVLDQLPVLLVSGDVNPEPLRGETAFLEIALQPYSAYRTDLADLITTHVVREEHLDPQEFSKARVVVLANVRQLNEVQVKGLENFVREGGSVLIFPGDRVNAAWYNTKLMADGKGILPLRIMSLSGSLKEDVQPPAAIVSQHYEHPSLEPFNDPRRGSLRGAQIRLWYKLERPLVAPVAQSDITILARLDTGDPFLVEKEFGEGRVIQCCAPCDADWSNLPMRPFYLPLMQQLVTYLASKVYPPRNSEIGQRLAAFLPLADAGKKAILTAPDGEKHELPVVEKGTHSLVEFNDTIRPGLYLLETPGREMIHFVVNTPREESDLSRLGNGELQSLAQEMDATVVKSWKEYREMDRGRRFGREIWSFLLWLALILMFTELFLAQLFARRST